MHLRSSDHWETPEHAICPEFLAELPKRPFTFVEPCCASGKLVKHITHLSHGSCVSASDIIYGMDVVDITHFFDADMVITNPPYMSSSLIPILCHFIRHIPSWCLLPADFAFRSRSGFILPYCSTMVAVGQIKWIENSESRGRHNFAWYRFETRRCKTRFICKRDGRRYDHVPNDFLA